MPTSVHTYQKYLYPSGDPHRKKKVREFPVPSRDVTIKLSLGGNNDVITELFLPRGSLVSDVPAGDGKLVNLFLRCSPFNPFLPGGGGGSVLDDKSTDVAQYGRLCS